MANRRIQPEEVRVKGIKIYSIVVTPKRTYDEQFILFGDSMEYKRGLVHCRHDQIKWSLDTNDPAFMKKWLSVANDLQEFHMPNKFVFATIENGSYVYKKTVTSITLNEEGFWWTLPIEFEEHPLIGASKSMLSVLRKIAAMIPEGWARPYTLDNLGGK